MIIDPDFFEHWRTRMLVDALGGDQMAPMYVMRVWAHCQSRRSTSFNMPAAGLKALCRYAGDASLLESSLCDAGFIERNGSDVDVPAWAEHNAKLIANWENGGRGGRPKTPKEEPTDNPNKTHVEPTETHGEPIGLDKSRLDIEKTKSEASTSRNARKPAKIPLPENFDISDRVRTWATAKGHEHLDRHLENFLCACRKAGYVYVDWDEALMDAIRKDWAKLSLPQSRAGPPVAFKTSTEKAKEWADKITGKHRNEQPDLIDINDAPA